jgi:hypothetical protein
VNKLTSVHDLMIGSLAAFRVVFALLDGLRGHEQPKVKYLPARPPRTEYAALPESYVDAANPVSWLAAAD